MPHITHAHSPGFLALVEDAKQRIRELTVDEYRERSEAGEPFILVDVREDHEWAKGHLPGALHIGKGVIERDIERTIGDKQAPIVCQCGGGFRSALVADNLRRMGYTNVWSLAGGYRAWTGKGLPIEQG